MNTFFAICQHIYFNLNNCYVTNVNINNLIQNLDNQFIKNILIINKHTLQTI